MRNLNSAKWGSSIAWMVDHNGNAVGVDNHMQSGESGLDLLDEWGVVTAYEYGVNTNRYEYTQAAKVLAYYIVTEPFAADWDDLKASDEWDWEAAVKSAVDASNVRKFLKILGLPKFKESAGDAMSRILDMGVDPDGSPETEAIQDAMQSLTLLFQRLMMRVRAGGLTNSLERGAKELYFRVPDMDPSAWKTGIANFIWDHPEYAGFECYIYSDIGGEKKPLEEYADCKQFLEMNSSRQCDSRKVQKFNSCYRQSGYFYKLFQMKVAARLA